MSKRSKREPRSSKPLEVGFVCEGSTDIVVLRRIVEEVFGEVYTRTLSPETDELDRQVPGRPSGWSEVRAWCQRVTDFEEYFQPDIGDPLDLLVIAIDLDIAIAAGLEKLPLNLGAYDATSLCRIIKSWLPNPVPGRVVIAIPVMAVEGWILAALFPRLGNVESEAKPADVLVSKKKIQQGRNGPWKRVVEYRPFAETVARKLKHVRQTCGEADRFVKKLEAIRDANA